MARPGPSVLNTLFYFLLIPWDLKIIPPETLSTVVESGLRMILSRHTHTCASSKPRTSATEILILLHRLNLILWQRRQRWLSRHCRASSPSMPKDRDKCLLKRWHSTQATIVKPDLYSPFPPSTDLAAHSPTLFPPCSVCTQTGLWLRRNVYIPSSNPGQALHLRDFKESVSTSSSLPLPPVMVAANYS